MARLCLVLLFTSACSWFESAAPPVRLAVRPARTTLPVLEASDAKSLLGRCLTYRPEGTYRSEACPPGVAEALGKAGRKAFDSGQHEIGVVWMQSGPDGPPGFRGSGGYFHAYESHILEVHFARVGSSQPAPQVLDRLDALCRETGKGNDRAVIDRAYGGCALVKRGLSPTAPSVTLADIGASNESWGRPQRFHAVEDVLEPETGAAPEGSTAPACEGDLMAVEVSVLRLTDLCHAFVREWLLVAFANEAESLRAKLIEVGTTRDQLSAELEGLLEIVRAEAAAPAPEEDKKKKKKSKQDERDERRAERAKEKRRANEQRLRGEVNRLADQRSVLETRLSEVEQRLELYSDDPYMFRAARSRLSAQREVPGAPEAAVEVEVVEEK